MSNVDKRKGIAMKKNMMIITLMLSSQMMNGMNFSRKIIPPYTNVETKKFFHIVESYSNQFNEKKTINVAMEKINDDLFDIVLARTSFSAIDKRDEEGNTALHHATKSLNPKRVEKLLARGAHENALNKDGRTPIMEAVLFPSEQLCDEKVESLLSIINMLCQAGANVSLADKNEKTVKCYIHERLDKLGFFDRRTIYYSENGKLMQTYEKIGLLLADPIRASE